MSQQIYIYNVRYKKSAMMKEGASHLFLVAGNISREEWIKAIKGADEDLDLRTAQWVGSTFGEFKGVKPLNFDVDVEVKV